MSRNSRRSSAGQPTLRSRRAPSHRRRRTHRSEKRRGRSYAPFSAITSAETSPTPTPQANDVRAVVRVSRPAIAASLLIGAAIALVTIGLALRLRQSFVPQPPSAATGVVAALFALAFGVRAPQRLTYRYAIAAWRRFAQGAAARFDLAPLVGHGPVDGQLCWMVLAVVALAAGIATALMPPTVSLFSHFYAWLHTHFLWSAAPFAVLQLAFALAACLIPCAAMGLAVALLHVLYCPDAEWDIRASAYVAIGASAGCFAIALAESAALPPDSILLAASLPLLLTALIASAMASKRASPSSNGQTSQESMPPVSIDSWPVLLRAGVVAIGGAAAFAMTVWSQLQAAADAGAFFIVAASLASLAIGIIVERAAGRGAARNVGGFGVAYAIAGITIALGALTLLYGRPISTPLAVLLVGCAVAAAGYCLSYGREALMARVALRSAVSALTLARLMFCAGATIWFAAPPANGVLSGPATLIILAVALVALGGVLILHEPNYDPASRRIRLVAVFASIVVLGLLVPLATR